jgi:hypothetical protein
MTPGLCAWGGVRRAVLALLVMGTAAGALAGCASTASYPTTQGAVKAPARIRNLSMSAVRVYVEAGGQTFLIGSVQPLGSARLDLPPALAQRGTRVGLLVAPMARNRWIGQRVLVADLLVDELVREGWTVVDSAY